jgi:hypothetical protein
MSTSQTGETVKTNVWTVATRPPAASRFRRVDLALEWEDATEMGRAVCAAAPELQVYVVPNAAYDAANSAHEDAYNILTDDNDRVEIVEGGVLPPGVTVESLRPGRGAEAQ